MKEIQSLWLMLTAVVPGIVFYGTLRIFIAIFKIDITFLIQVDQSATLSFSILTAIIFLHQVVAIVLELLLMKIGFYKHSIYRLQEVFVKRYEIISSLTREQSFHVERIFSQYLLSHNIAVALVLNTLSTGLFIAFNLSYVELFNIFPIAGLIILTTMSLYVSHARFDIACRALLVHSR